MIVCDEYLAISVVSETLPPTLAGQTLVTTHSTYGRLLRVIEARLGDDSLAVTGHVERRSGDHPADRVDARLRRGSVEFLVEEAPDELGEADAEFRGPLLGPGMHVIGHRDDGPHDVMS